MRKIYMESNNSPSQSSPVFIKATDNFNYEINRLSKDVAEGLDKIYGKDHFKPGKTVLIKPNLLMKADPEDAITTHPHMIIAVARILKQKGCQVYVADNPGGFGSHKSVKEIYEYLKLTQYPDLFTLLYNDKPPLHKNNIPLSWWADKCDEIINMPKLKTHDLVLLTLAVKNTFGFIAGLKKSSLHREYPKPAQFSQTILDIHDRVNPQIHILDGILSLEGEGPGRRGTVKKRGLILISPSALSLDCLLCRLIGLPPEKVPYLKLAIENRGFKPETIETFPANIEDLKVEDFLLPPETILNKLPSPLLKVLSRILKLKLSIANELCINCKKCMQVCPVNAIYLKQNERVTINTKKCIMCMCCREICPEGAVITKHNLIFRIIRKLIK